MPLPPEGIPESLLLVKLLQHEERIKAIMSVKDKIRKPRPELRPAYFCLMKLKFP